MRILGLHIDGCFSFKDFSIGKTGPDCAEAPLGPAVFLIGDPDSGKENLRKFFFFLNSMFNSKGRRISPIDIGADIEMKDSMSFSIYYAADSEKAYCYDFVFRDGIVVKETLIGDDGISYLNLTNGHGEVVWDSGDTTEHAAGLPILPSAYIIAGLEGCSVIQEFVRFVGSFCVSSNVIGLQLALAAMPYHPIDAYASMPMSATMMALAAKKKHPAYNELVKDFIKSSKHLVGIALDDKHGAPNLYFWNKYSDCPDTQETVAREILQAFMLRILLLKEWGIGLMFIEGLETALPEWEIENIADAASRWAKENNRQTFIMTNSSFALLPAFPEDVFVIDKDGLGCMSAARASEINGVSDEFEAGSSMGRIWNDGFLNRGEKS